MESVDSVHISATVLQHVFGTKLARSIAETVLILSNDSNFTMRSILNSEQWQMLVDHLDKNGISVLSIGKIEAGTIVATNIATGKITSTNPFTDKYGHTITNNRPWY